MFHLSCLPGELTAVLDGGLAAGRTVSLIIKPGHAESQWRGEQVVQCEALGTLRADCVSFLDSQSEQTDL